MQGVVQQPLSTHLHNVLCTFTNTFSCCNTCDNTGLSTKVTAVFQGSHLSRRVGEGSTTPLRPSRYKLSLILVMIRSWIRRWLRLSHNGLCKNLLHWSLISVISVITDHWSHHRPVKYISPVSDWWCFLWPQWQSPNRLVLAQYRTWVIGLTRLLITLAARSHVPWDSVECGLGPPGSLAEFLNVTVSLSFLECLLFGPLHNDQMWLGFTSCGLVYSPTMHCNVH